MGKRIPHNQVIPHNQRAGLMQRVAVESLKRE